MQDSKSVEAIAAELRDDAATQASLLEESNDQRACAISSCLSDVKAQLAQVRETPTGGVRISLTESKDAKGRLTGLRVDISMYPSWLCRPFATCHVTAYASDRDSAAVPHVRIEWPPTDTSLGRSLDETMSKLRNAGHGGVVGEVKVIAAECLNRRASFEFASPVWYRAIGTALGWPIALLVYLATWLVFGLWGFLLGWIPAWIAFALSRWLWLPGLLLAGAALLRS